MATNTALSRKLPMAPEKACPQGQVRDHAAEPTREDRLKAALKANMARRKAQARARAAATETDNEERVRRGRWIRFWCVAAASEGRVIPIAGAKNACT